MSDPVVSHVAHAEAGEGQKMGDDCKQSSSAEAGQSYVSWYGGERRQTWQTPPALFERLNAEYGFTLDGASEPGNGLLPRASTADDPLPWTFERVFCNPPWSNIAPFVEQAAHAELAVLLVPARTNARWFHRALELGASVVYFLGKPKFVGAKHTSPVDCVLLVFERPASLGVERSLPKQEGKD